ncbi:hypothetical protein BUALT_Bualt06G0038600 [Buddleja alternifolia]|uniref:Ubiquitin-like domain-containing protein n=1 Tax=Buddleja alternifolia TaxID=168488 RepID=A0AAV6XJH8_9LAMI|nr:hypothetical protein BUALT_Bualt06G0038600 [Buddleja alternifolia]
MEGGATSSRKRQLDQQIRPKDGGQEYYRVMSDTKLQKLFTLYCKDKDLDYSALVFLYNGRKIKTTKTPEELGMEDGDCIDAMANQNGGGYSCMPI